MLPNNSDIITARLNGLIRILLRCVLNAKLVYRKQNDESAVNGGALREYTC